jgi:hypothetical protein
MPAAPAAVDVEAAVAAWLRGELPSVRVSTEAPADLAGQVPAVRVVRIGGADQGVVFDGALLDVDCWHGSRAAARALALQVHDRLAFGLPGQRLTGGVVCAVRTATGVAWRPWDDTGLRRFQASYEITVQAQS